jgi:hypothetical protein
MTEKTLLAGKSWSSSRVLNENHWELELTNDGVTFSYYALFDCSGDEDEFDHGYALFSRNGFAQCLETLMQGEQAELVENGNTIKLSLNGNTLHLVISGRTCCCTIDEQIAPPDAFFRALNLPVPTAA